MHKRMGDVFGQSGLLLSAATGEHGDTNNWH
jgi:hypothetical protein